MSEGVLAAAAVAAIVALMYPPVARWAWAAAAIAVAAWAALESGLLGGAPLVAGVVVATAVERGDAPAAPGFSDMLARLAVLGGAILASVLMTVRVLVVDLVDGVQVLILLAVGSAAILYLLVHGGPVEEARAARLALVVAAAGWVAAGHPAAVVGLTAGGLLIVFALAPRRLASR
ncbi:MAG TPA: hypothetical protein VGR61_10510 [Candidatus Dormibacteraeota bacterium]|nr:hypothetical protein [Candidatus Dormibacteraeota bacterium]